MIQSIMFLLYKKRIFKQIKLLVNKVFPLEMTEQNNTE